MRSRFFLRQQTLGRYVHSGMPPCSFPLNSDSKADMEGPPSEPPAERVPQASVAARFKGVRMRKWGKWVAEVRLPNSRDRIWLGSYDAPEKAARAYDAAVFCLRGPGAKFNFPDNPPDIPDAENLTSAQIQAVAAKFAHEGASATTQSPPDTTSPSEVDTVEAEAPQWSPEAALIPSEGGCSDVGVFGSVFDEYPGNCYFPSEADEEDDDEDGGGGGFYQSPRLWSF